jgi:hypothetical protein
VACMGALVWGLPGPRYSHLFAYLAVDLRPRQALLFCSNGIFLPETSIAQGLTKRVEPTLSPIVFAWAVRLPRSSVWIMLDSLGPNTR